jgi:hypothetical protein
MKRSSAWDGCLSGANLKLTLGIATTKSLFRESRRDGKSLLTAIFPRVGIWYLPIIGR